MRVTASSDLPDIYPWIGLAASIATIATVLGSAIKYFRDKNAETTRASENLYLELEDALTSLDAKGFPDDVYNTKIKDLDGGEKKVYFMARSLNHDFYDSLICSGKINFLDPSLQQPIQDIFKRIKMHNRYVDAVLEMAEGNDSLVPPEAHKYCAWIDDTEKRLQKELPKTMRSLRAHFKTNRRTQALLRRFLARCWQSSWTAARAAVPGFRRMDFLRTCAPGFWTCFVFRHGVFKHAVDAASAECRPVSNRGAPSGPAEQGPNSCHTAHVVARGGKVRDGPPTRIRQSRRPRVRALPTSCKLPYDLRVRFERGFGRDFCYLCPSAVSGLLAGWM